jgi:hypothetical protein
LVGGLLQIGGGGVEGIQVVGVQGCSIQVVGDGLLGVKGCFIQIVWVSYSDSWAGRLLY